MPDAADEQAVEQERSPAEEAERSDARDAAALTDAEAARDASTAADEAPAAVAPQPTTPSAEALALAERALDEVTPRGAVGEVVDALAIADDVLSLRYRSALEGYPDWLWTVALSTDVEGAPTVLEVSLLPGDSSLVAPEWVPWADRLAEYLAAKEHEAAEAAEAVGDDEAAGDDEDESGEDFDDFDEDDLASGDDDLGIDEDDDAVEADAGEEPADAGDTRDEGAEAETS